ncbi:DedA family protein [Sphingomonas sp. BAUL-RG-20F-R05-02]|uniref:DedA family protein n=1 Tax=Sphingomonas sp. BAUL-RG-20F-R05-02 TaxID=2914830 RepID=UPI001F5643FA|nr:DedA family protein [Sphingomonas sp. BAUL-RG-20F-R05-02]
MTIELLIARYGLIALFFGAGIEGEACVITGGVFAHRGVLSLPAAMVAAALGSFAADQVLFLLGRRYRNLAWVRRLHDKPAFARAIAMIEQHPNRFIFVFRFLYGLRTVSPVAIGTTKIPARRFLLINALAAIIWAIAFTTVGFVFGHALEALLGELLTPVNIAIVVAVIAVLAAVIWLVRRSRNRASDTTR